MKMWFATAAVLCNLSGAYGANPVFTSENGKLLADGQPMQLKGLNWHGFQTTAGVFHGLYAQPPSAFLDLLSDNKFNAVRVTLDTDLMLNDRSHGYVKPEEDEKHVAPYKSPLMGMTSLEVLDWFVDQFAERGVLVLLDLHCLDTGGTNKSPVFFNDQFPVTKVMEGWGKMAKRYGDKWNVLGADVFNEPFGATWAEGSATDMDAFAVQAAATIHADAPNWLIFVEGSSKSPTCSDTIDGDVVSCGYGDNLKGVRDSPVQLAAADKLVYSPHTYGPSQHDRPEFSNANYPSNMPDVWDNHWGYIRDLPNSPAVVLGEWGGELSGANLQWTNALVDYLTSKDMQSNFFWCLNEDSDPVGIVTNWATTPMAIDSGKLDLLARLTPAPTDMAQVHAATSVVV